MNTLNIRELNLEIDIISRLFEIRTLEYFCYFEFFILKCEGIIFIIELKDTLKGSFLCNVFTDEFQITIYIIFSRSFSETCL